MKITSSRIKEIAPKLEGVYSLSYSRTPPGTPVLQSPPEHPQGLPEADLLWDLGIIPYDTVLARKVRHFMGFPDVNYRWKHGKFASIDQFSNDKGALGHYVALRACFELDFFPWCNTENGAGADVILPHDNALIEVRSTSPEVKLTGSRVIGTVVPRYIVFDPEHRSKWVLVMPVDSPIVKSGADELKRWGIHVIFFSHQIRCQSDIDPSVDAVKFQLRCLLLPIEGSPDILAESKKLEKSLLAWLFGALRSGFRRLLYKLRPSGSSPYLTMILPVTLAQATKQNGGEKVENRS